MTHTLAINDLTSTELPTYSIKYRGCNGIIALEM